MTPLRARNLAALAALAILSACGRLIPEGRPSVTPAPPIATGSTGALSAGVRAGPAIASLGMTAGTAGPALASFRESCPKLLSRTDASGLTRGADWQAACTSAATWPLSDAHRFFETSFETATVADGSAFVTGYYEPEIAGVRVRQTGFDVPVYALPPDLVRAKAGEAPANPNGTQPLGRYDESGKFVPYYDRAQIDGGALAGKGLELGWAADPVEFFFVQIQGSGRLRAPDGSVLRIGYAGQNGQPYSSIGALMRQRGLVGTGPGQYPGTMQGIMQYVREKPEEGRALLQENKSWVFFRELTGDGPTGAMGVPVRAHASLAADPAYVPLGAPVWLALDRAEASGLWVAQDTGGAIKGANRFDSFWGAGDYARQTAGTMSGRGQAVLLLPKGTLARLGVQ
ncbi:MAG: murein transglycosylase A [Sphingomonadales bacterium]|nr:murein transglycosylase A [Sphingomonadales bacterium]